ncbi:MAG: hypothetical protein IVW57_10305, partial [Ktedonobacterales bacterium]|nr:hypothetical protein [Ktedonobacterales bacterium]
MARGERRTRHGHAGGHGAERSHHAVPQLTDDQRAAVEALVGEVSALAQALRQAQSDGRAALAAQLERVEQVEEPVALAFAIRLGELRGEQGTDAANVAAALGELEPRREVAREARRARLRLGSTGIVPTLVIPPLPVGAVAAPFTPARAAAADPSSAASFRHGPRLVEAYATRSRESGEMSLLLGWQESLDPDQVRGHLFLLDFWHDGVRDFSITEMMTRRHFTRDLVSKLKSTEDVKSLPLPWEQARHLVLEALEVNDWRGTTPAEAFTEQRAQLEARLLGEPEDEVARAAVAAEEDRFRREGDRPFIAPDMEPDETVANWIGAWSYGDYGLAYDLLADDNPLRQAQTREEYLALRRQWAAEAEPAALRMTLVREQERRASALWVPGATGALAGAGKEVEAFWSATLKDSPLGGQIEEVPMATLLSQETGRHWYWTAYTLRHDRAHGLWLLSRLRDEGKAAQGLTLEELQRRLKDAHDEMEQMAQTAPPNPGDKEATELVRRLTGLISTALHYDDALIVRLPLDEATYRAAVDDARALANHERAAALLER